VVYPEPYGAALPSWLGATFSFFRRSSTIPKNIFLALEFKLEGLISLAGIVSALALKAFWAL
jgi:hypothetical protein